MCVITCTRLIFFLEIIKTRELKEVNGLSNLTPVLRAKNIFVLYFACKYSLLEILQQKTFFYFIWFLELLLIKPATLAQCIKEMT